MDSRSDNSFGSAPVAGLGRGRLFADVGDRLTPKETLVPHVLDAMHTGIIGIRDCAIILLGLAARNEPRIVLLWYFRVPVSGSRPRETRTSQVRGPREMSWPAFRAMSYLRLESGHTIRTHVWRQ
jgi:hypothetical protein